MVLGAVGVVGTGLVGVGVGAGVVVDGGLTAGVVVSVSAPVPVGAGLEESLLQEIENIRRSISVFFID